MLDRCRYLPPYHLTSMEFLKEVLAGRKRVLLRSQIKPVSVPVTRYITTARVLALAKQEPRIMQYIPDRPNLRACHVSREFLFNIVNTLDSEFFPEVLNQVEKYRTEGKGSKKPRLVEIDPEMAELFEKLKGTFYRKPGGRSMMGNLLTTSKKRKAPTGYVYPPIVKKLKLC